MHITISARPTKAAIIYEAVIRAATKADCESLHFLKLLYKKHRLQISAQNNVSRETSKRGTNIMQKTRR